MDLLSVLRMLGGLGVVLGLMAGALWVVRRYDIKLPGRIGGGSDRRLEIVERLPIDQRRSLALIRRDDREHLILLSPDGSVVVETSIMPDPERLAAAEERRAAERARVEAEAAKVRGIFANLVEKAVAGTGIKPRGEEPGATGGKADHDA